MALVKIKNFVVPIARTHHRVVFNVIRKSGYVKTKFDWMPGPYPKNDEERRKAAEKYGLHPAEYKPYEPDDFLFSGDYPSLPLKAKSLEDPNYPWDYPDEKRNFGEVMHFNHNLLQEDKTDIGERLTVGYWEAPLTFWGIVLAGGAINWICWQYPLFKPRMEKQLPSTGQVHYTFEPAHH